MIIYDKLWNYLEEKNMKRTDLLQVISSPTLAKLGKNDTVNIKVIAQICDFLNCQPSDIMENVNAQEWATQTMYKSLGGLFETLEKTTGKNSKTLWNEFLKHAPNKMKNDADFKDIQTYIEQLNNETEEEQKNT